MPWDGSLLGGFTSGEPWLPLGPDHASINVMAMSESRGSILNLYRRLIELQRNNLVLTHGAIEAADVEGKILRYERRQGNDRLALALNLGHEQTRVSHSSGRVLLSTYLDRPGEDVDESVSLRADEGIIVQVKLRAGD
jgi:alpha-glucosidase